MKAIYNLNPATLLRVAAAILFLNPPQDLRAGGVVTVANESNLRTAMSGGGLVTFSVSGTIALTNTLTITNSTTLDASGHDVLLSGNHTFRLFEVEYGGSLSLTNLILANGRSTNGGAIYNEGTLIAGGCTFMSNTVVGVAGVRYETAATDGFGGAVCNMGVAQMRLCSFSNNAAVGGNGGVMRVTNGNVFISHTVGSGLGGAIYNGGTLTSFACSFTDNASTGGVGASEISAFAGGAGEGGAVYNSQTATFVSSLFAGNRASGGRGADAGGGMPRLGGSGGMGAGGAVSSVGTLFCTNSTFSNNSAEGGQGGTTAGENQGGAGAGGAVCVQPNSATFSFCTLANNAATGAPSILNPPGTGEGAGIYSATNSVASLHSSIIAYHTNGALAGPIIDLGYNLCSDGSGSLTNAGSISGVDPQLELLQNNGGPTMTHALSAASPAIGAGDTLHSPPEDQRGVSRPQYASSDMGSVEFEGVWPRVLQFASGEYSVVEGGADPIVTVICAGNPNGAVSVECMTANGTAVAPSDYVATNIVLSFASGETNKSFTVTVADDEEFEENETLTLTLSNPTGSSVLDSPSSTLVRIVEKALPNGINSSAEFMAAAARGGEVTFGYNGTYSVSKTVVVTNALTIDGRLRHVTINGLSTRPFVVRAGGLLKLRNVRISEGWSTNGGAIYNDGGAVEIEQCCFEENRAVGRWSSGFGQTYPFPYPATSGSGGAIHNEKGTVRITTTTFRANRAVGGNSQWSAYYPNGADGMGGAIFTAGEMFLTDSTLEANEALGGTGAAVLAHGGTGFGGALYNLGLLSMTNVTMTGNAAAGGQNEPDFASTFHASGGGFYSGGGTALVQNATIAGNLALVTNGGIARGFNIAETNSHVELSGSIVAGLHTRPNTYGSLTDLGHNLSTDHTGAFTNSTSIQNIDPKLAPLADNGGATWTMALLPDSPAIDAAASVPELVADQRGVPRPYGTAFDMGAYEWNGTSYYSYFVLNVSQVGSGRVHVSGYGPTGQVFRTRVSSNLVDWSVVSTNQVGPDGSFDLEEVLSAAEPARFYQTIAP